MLRAAIVSAAFRDLPAGTFRVLLAIISRVPRQDPGVPFIARASRCAEDASISTKTVSRAILRFVNEGWLEAKGERLPSGQYAAGSYRVTGALLAVLDGGAMGSAQDARYADLITQELAAKTIQSLPLDNNVPRLSNVDLQIKEDQTRQSPPQQSIEPSVREDLFIKDKAQKNHPHFTPLPEDVAPLEGIGIHPLMAYRLMGMATSAGHRLGDVVALALPHLSRLALTGWRAYRYLVRMISKKVAYAERAVDVRENQVRKKEASFLEDAAQRYDGQRFVAPNGSNITIMKGRAEIVKKDGSIWGCAGRGMLELYEDIVAGVLRPLGKA
jgi:hypothetical protein